MFKSLNSTKKREWERKKRVIRLLSTLWHVKTDLASYITLEKNCWTYYQIMTCEDHFYNFTQRRSSVKFLHIVSIFYHRKALKSRQNHEHLFMNWWCAHGIRPIFIKLDTCSLVHKGYWILHSLEIIKDYQHSCWHIYSI